MNIIKNSKKDEGCELGTRYVFFDLKRVDYSRCEGNYLMSGCDSRDFETAMSAFVSLPKLSLMFFLLQNFCLKSLGEWHQILMFAILKR